MKKLLAIFCLLSLLILGGTDMDAKKTIAKKITRTSKKSSTSQNGLNLKKLVDAFNHKTSKLDRVWDINMKTDGVAVMKQLGFSLVSTTKDRFRTEDYEGNVEMQDGLLYKFKKDNVIVDIQSIGNGLSGMTITFPDDAACREFIKSSQSALGKKLTLSSDQYSYVDKNWVIWYFFKNGKTIDLHIEDYMG